MGNRFSFFRKSCRVNNIVIVNYSEYDLRVHIEPGSGAMVTKEIKTDINVDINVGAMCGAVVLQRERKYESNDDTVYQIIRKKSEHESEVIVNMDMPDTAGYVKYEARVDGNWVKIGRALKKSGGTLEVNSGDIKLVCKEVRNERQRKIPHGRYLFMGNPGVGKSTLANAFIGKYDFESGTTGGEGLTREFKFIKIRPDVWVGDTPGLADAGDKASVMKQIEKALKFGGKYRIIFVINSQGGRIHVEDKTTIGAILQAAANQITHFGIIINKTSEKLYKKDMDNDGLLWKEKVLLLKNGLKYTDCQVCHNLLSQKINDAAGAELVENEGDEKNGDFLYHMSDELWKFITTLPTVMIDKEKVTAFPSEAKDYELLKTAHEKLNHQMAKKIEQITHLTVKERHVQLDKMAEVQEVQTSESYCTLSIITASAVAGVLGCSVAAVMAFPVLATALTATAASASGAAIVVKYRGYVE